MAAVTNLQMQINQIWLPWTPANTGTPTDLVIEDAATGIDIPAGDQIEIDVFVVLEDTVTNTTGLVFANTAGYTHNWIDGDPLTQGTGVAGVSPNMTIEAPDLVLQKSGPPVLPAGSTAVYTLDVQNVGGASAWNPTLLDQVANPTPGGMCDVPPASITAQVYQADGTTPVGAALVENTDCTAAFVLERASANRISSSRSTTGRNSARVRSSRVTLRTPSRSLSSAATTCCW